MVKERNLELSDDENEREVLTSTRKMSIGASKATSKNKEPSPMEEDERDDGDEGSNAGSEEYEIEEIIDAKHGAFPAGRLGYLVKWKGYGEEHNSWVDENDAGNAQGLIEEYWRKQKAEKKSRGKPAAQPRRSTGTTKGRMSISQRDESSEVEETRQKLEEVRTKKRGRPSKASVEREQGGDEEDEEPQPEKKKKRHRKSTNGFKAKGDAEPMDEDEEEEYVDMKRWAKLPSWERLVESIDTVERVDDHLFVYFTLINNQGRGREESTQCRDKFKDMLLDFYEKNLRWREDTDTAQK
ncbi:hypothetical protein BKA93DRAFT_782998 [Sparassis latifolia]|uniref:Chromo domain-containing protein n=1 Tax=Sparassis crispa TaxID=139825 RepID=A0A401GWD1_9APHY|nr:predicted protein [Sparassis crispa]GBE86535.1 predicted protein [Sparassis crispa]